MFKIFEKKIFDPFATPWGKSGIFLRIQTIWEMALEEVELWKTVKRPVQNLVKVVSKS